MELGTLGAGAARAGNARDRSAAGAREAALVAALGRRPLVLVGLMGAGKTTVGRRLAARLGLPFADADAAIEEAAGMSVAELFERHGEPAFREGEGRVVARLLEGGPRVLATGGGAFLREDTRERMARAAVSVWLRADLDVLMRRVRRRADRPLLRGPDPEGVMRRLVDERYPVYALAAVHVPSREGPHEAVVEDVVRALEHHLGLASGGEPAPERCGAAR